MKAHKYIGLGWVVIGASLMMACADHKGFQARKATPEQIFKAKMAKMEQGLAAPPGGDGQVPAGGDAVSVPARAENGGSPAVDFSEQDINSDSNFAQVVNRANQNGGIADPKAPAASANAKTADEQKILAKLAEIKAALSPEAVEIIKGITVTLKMTSSQATKAEDRRFAVTVDMLLAIGENDVTASGGASLAAQDQFKSLKIVEVRLNRVMDSLTKELKLKGVEVYATCSVDTCETVKILVLITREDGKQVSMIGDFSADGAGRGTSLGNQLRTLQEAQDLRAKEREDRNKAADQPARQAAEGQGQQNISAQREAGGQGATTADQSSGGTATNEFSNPNGGLSDKAIAIIMAQEIDNTTEQKVIRHEGDEKKAVEKRFPGIEDIALREKWEAEQEVIKTQALQKVEKEREASELAAKRVQATKASIDQYFDKKEAIAAKKAPADKMNKKDTSWWDLLFGENKRWTYEKKPTKSEPGVEYDHSETLKYYSY